MQDTTSPPGSTYTVETNEGVELATGLTWDDANEYVRTSDFPSSDLVLVREVPATPAADEYLRAMTDANPDYRDADPEATYDRFMRIANGKAAVNPWPWIIGGEATR